MIFSRRHLLKGGSTLALAGSAGDAKPGTFAQFMVNGGGGGAAAQWYALPVGGGGYQSKLSMHSSGFLFTGTDTVGCYATSTVVGTANTQLWNANSMPASYLPSPYMAGDCYDLVIDPNNANTLYFYWSCNNTSIATVLKSTNQGASWAATGFPITTARGNGTNHPSIRQMIAVDPLNSNVVWVGGYDALRVSFNGGTSFSTVGSITAPGTDPGVCAIQFDPTSGTTTNGGQTVTKRMLLSVYGTGIYYSTDGGATFALIASSPTGVMSSQMGSDGNYYASAVGSTTMTRISTSNVLTSITCGTAFGNFLIDPNNPAHGIAFNGIGGSGTITFGSAVNTGTPTATANFPGSISVTATDVPWISPLVNGQPSGGPSAWDPLVTTSVTSLTIGTGSKTLTVGTSQNIKVGDSIRVSNTGTLTNYMKGVVTAYTPGSGSLTFTVGNDFPSEYLGAQTGGSGTFSAWTVTKDRIWEAVGYGLLYVDAPSSGNLTYISQTLGIESLSSCAVLWPPGHSPQLIASDFPFRTQTSNPVGQVTGNNTFRHTPGWNTSIVDGNFICYAISDPSTLFCVIPNNILKSTDEGATWAALASIPSGLGSGAWIAASSANNIVVSAGTTAWYTTNGGTSWTAPTGMPTTAQGAYGLAGSPLIADSVTAGTFYCYDNGTHVYSSTNSGANWTQVGTTGNFAIPATLVSVPGNAGHLLCAFGIQSGTGANPVAVVASSPTTGHGVQFSSNGGATWTALPNLAESISVACGAAKSGGNGYPSFAFAGWVSNVYGLWRVDNFNTGNIAGTTYTNIGTYPNNSIDIPISIAGDSLNWNRWIVSQTNSGWRYYGTGSGWP